MELVIFIGLFFMFAIYLMPVLGLGYKICEGVHKRALFAKAAMQIQVFSAAFLFLVSLALFADYFMQGILFEASSAFSAVSNLDFWKDFLLHLGLMPFLRFVRPLSQIDISIFCQWLRGYFACCRIGAMDKFRSRICGFARKCQWFRRLLPAGCQPFFCFAFGCFYG